MDDSTCEIDRVAADSRGRHCAERKTVTLAAAADGGAVKYSKQQHIQADVQAAGLRGCETA